MRIGVVTLYKDSVNFGGLLQAKAMIDFLNHEGHQAQQILLGQYTERFRSRTVLKKLQEHGIKYAFELLKGRSKGSNGNVDVSESVHKCGEFRQGIPHTATIDEDDLSSLDSCFDGFITGSDQVWNPKWTRAVYLLQFTKKRKLSYAASIARFDFTRYEKNQLKNALKEFDWISVREKAAADFLKNKLGVNPDLVLDPTMLLTAPEWEQSENKVKIPEKYICCYFLVQTPEKRKYAQKFAEKYGCQIVYPVFNGMKYDWEQSETGEHMEYAAGPREFLYLIHHAQYVLTDSFHGTVFSILYHVPFTHLLREDAKFSGNMNSRIDSLLDIFDLKNHVCSCTDVPEWKNIDYSRVEEILQKERARSSDLLRQALTGRGSYQ